MLNMAESGFDFEIPPLEGRRWLKVIDTALPSPMDIAEPGKETAVSGNRYPVNKHSVVVLAGA
jgi:glycogen operon protein